MWKTAQGYGTGTHVIARPMLPLLSNVSLDKTLGIDTAAVWRLCKFCITAGMSVAIRTEQEVSKLVSVHALRLMDNSV